MLPSWRVVVQEESENGFERGKGIYWRGGNPFTDCVALPRFRFVDTIYALTFLAVWFAALAAPIVIAGFFWRVSRKAVNRVWAHLACAPLVLIGEYGLIWLMFWASGDDGEGPPGLGLAILPCLFSTVLALAVYYLALAADAFREWLRRSKR